MTVKSNLLVDLTTNVHSEAAPQTYCVIINALTGLACASLMKHIGQQRRGELHDDEVNTLEARNEMDEDARGEEVSDLITHMSGFAKPLPAMKVAQIADGIRYSMYQEMHAWAEFAPAESLYRTPTQSITARINWNQPMSAQLYMDYRIKLAATPNQTEVEMAIKRSPNISAELIREAFADEARKSHKRLIELAPNVLSELSSFEDVYSEDAFLLLDIETQCQIGTKISQKFSDAYKRLLPSAMRDLDKLSQLNMIESQHTIAKRWLLDNDKELQTAMAVRKAA